jgi:hypothetical protein
MVNRGRKTRMLWVFGIIALSIGLLWLYRISSKPEVDPARDRLEKMNDSLFHQIELNSGKIDGLYIKIDSLNILSDTLLNKQTIVNEYHRNEVYNILSSDAKSNNRRLSETFRLSDSLLKSGFYTRTIKFPSTTD